MENPLTLRGPGPTNVAKKGQKVGAPTTFETNPGGWTKRVSWRPRKNIVYGIGPSFECREFRRHFRGNTQPKRA